MRPEDHFEVSRAPRVLPAVVRSSPFRSFVATGLVLLFAGCFMPVDRERVGVRAGQSKEEVSADRYPRKERCVVHVGTVRIRNVLAPLDYKFLDQLLESGKLSEVEDEAHRMDKYLDDILIYRLEHPDVQLADRSLLEDYFLYRRALFEMADKLKRMYRQAW